MYGHASLSMNNGTVGIPAAQVQSAMLLEPGALVRKSNALVEQG
jgi:hypothetical protein